MANKSEAIMNLVSNATLVKQVANFFNISVANVTNQSVVTQENLFDLYEAYRTREKEQLIVYKTVAYIVGTLIILSNLTVVISSGLILKRGQQPKSTYLLLGNVSLADTIIGISIIFGAIIDNSMSSNPLCIFQIGMIVCPAMVSIFSVGLIAVDRYFYILHGLYYQRYFNTTRVRIGILIIWMIGITLGFMPATGWVNDELINTRCYYVSLFPGALVLFNSLLSLIPITVITVLYLIILVRALRNVNDINAAQKSVKTNSNSNEVPKLRIYRGNTNVRRNVTPLSTKHHSRESVGFKIRRCASFNINTTANGDAILTKRSSFVQFKSKSINNLDDKVENNNTYVNTRKRTQSESESSIYTIQSSYSDSNILNSVSDVTETSHKCILSKFRKPKTPSKPNKWRAITVVMLTTGRIFIASLPAMGWTGQTFTNYRCWYVAVFPSILLIIVSIIVLSIIIMVCVLYFLILHRAVKTVDKIRKFKESYNYNIAFVNKSFETDEESCKVNEVSQTTVTITVSKETISEQTVNSLEIHDFSKTNIEEKQTGNSFKRKIQAISSFYSRAKALESHPSKLKAVQTVLLVTACFVGTWAPYYVSIIVYVKCDIMRNGYDCIPLEMLTLGPLYLLGVSNSLCDPLIYAWRHSGFKRTLKKIYWKFVLRRRV